MTDWQLTPMHTKTHHIFIPSLLTPLKQWQQGYGFNAKAPLLVKTLKHAAKKNHTALPWLQQACLLLTDNTAGSYAEQLYQAHFKQSTEKAILCASPISLTAGMSDIIVGHSVIENISPAQEKILITELNQHFSQDGWEFKVSTLGAWFLLLDKAQKPETTIPMQQALGASLRDLMEGKIEISWGKQLNELQMLLHNSAANQQRELTNQEPVKTFWLWDMKIQNTPTVNINFIDGGGKHAQKLAQHFLIENLEKDTSNSGFIIYDDLLVAAQNNDIDTWQKKLSLIEKAVLSLIENKEVNIFIYTDSGQAWNLGKSHFWSKLKLNRATHLIDLI